MEKSREKVSRIRQKINQLIKTKRIYINKLLHPKPMIIGSIHEVYRKCMTPNCCCTREGKKHGPYLALSISIKAKRTVKMVKKGDELEVQKKAESYKNYQQSLAKVRKINKEVDLLLEELKRIYLEEYK